jgi:hypothetical protein
VGNADQDVVGLRPVELLDLANRFFAEAEGKELSILPAFLSSTG